jgi:hypothetical protein
MAALMTGLCHAHFAVAGYDLGLLVGYAVAAGHYERAPPASSSTKRCSPAPPRPRR